MTLKSVKRYISASICLLLAILCFCTRPSYAAAAAAEPDLSTIRKEAAAFQSAKTDHDKALHAYLLNQAADDFADHLNKTSLSDRAGQQLVEQANRYGASIIKCTYSGTWTVPGDGYLRYLKLWPKGPNAEEAWWRGKLHYTANTCYDGAGTPEEDAAFVHDYSEFLQHFPSGRHEIQARAALKQWQEHLASY